MLSNVLAYTMSIGLYAPCDFSYDIQIYLSIYLSIYHDCEIFPKVRWELWCDHPILTRGLGDTHTSWESQR